MLQLDSVPMCRAIVWLWSVKTLAFPTFLIPDMNWQCTWFALSSTFMRKCILVSRPPSTVICTRLVLKLMVCYVAWLILCLAVFMIFHCYVIFVLVYLTY